MKLTVFTVCVDYADRLANALAFWSAYADEMLVVTVARDRETQGLCADAGVPIFLTELFYARGAAFNKARALSAAYEQLVPTAEWVLHVDADVIPPTDWRTIVEAAAPTEGRLYGARRQLEDGRIVHEGEIAGYFQLWHARDPQAQRRPLFDVSWRHAGGYDSEFQYRWPPPLRTLLPLTLVHQGKIAENWHGRGQVAAMESMLAARRKTRGGIGPDERHPVGSEDPGPPVHNPKGEP